MRYISLSGAYLVTSLLERHRYGILGPIKHLLELKLFCKFFSQKIIVKCRFVEIKPSQSPCDKRKWVSFSIFLHFFHVCGPFFLDTGPDKIQSPTIWGGMCLPGPPVKYAPDETAVYFLPTFLDASSNL